MLTVKHPVTGLGLVVTVAATALALAGCTSSGSSAPSWAAALGTGTTVTGPQSASPGHDSPGAAVQGYVSTFFAKNLQAACDYVEPSVQSKCKSDLAKIPSGTKLPYMQNEALGYVATNGTQALVGITGSVCSPTATPPCTTNKDPAAIFSSGKPFATLWSQAQAAQNNSSSAYSLAPCIQVNGQWYVDVPASSL
jgi:hypothetical protein